MDKPDLEKLLSSELVEKLLSERTLELKSNFLPEKFYTLRGSEVNVTTEENKNYQTLNMITPNNYAPSNALELKFGKEPRMTEKEKKHFLNNYNWH